MGADQKIARRSMVLASSVLAFSLLGSPTPVAYGQTQTPKAPSEKPAKSIPEGTMTLERMGEIIKLLDKNAKSPRAGIWQFKIEKSPVIIITDVKANRMRIMVPVRKAAKLTAKQLKRIAQANFDTALDARYAIARNLLWAVYIHPLSELHQRQFIKGIGQTVNLALTFGNTYNSGLLTYQGGDSRGILRRKLIDKLLKKGIPI